MPSLLKEKYSKKNLKKSQAKRCLVLTAPASAQRIKRKRHSAGQIREEFFKTTSGGYGRVSNLEGRAMIYSSVSH